MYIPADTFFVQAWEDKKNEIFDYYDGKTVLKYIDAVEYTLRNEDSLLESLSDDWFLKVFFNGVHICYGSNLVVETDAYFSIIPKKAIVKADVEQRIEEYLEKGNLILIKQKGELRDEEMKEKFLIDDDSAGNYEGEYFLNPNHYSIEKIKLACTLNLETTKKVTIEINNLNEKKEITIGTRQSIFVAEEKPKESFFKGLMSRL